MSRDTEKDIHSQEIMQEFLFDDAILSDADLLALAHFREKISLDYEKIDRRDPDALNAFLDQVTRDFCQERDLTRDKVAQVREILRESIMTHSYHDSKKTAEGQKNDVNMEYMKEMVEPNLESAVANYVKFVQPFENTRLFKEELATFREHQSRYLAEDLGIVNPQEKEVAMDVLMQLVRESAAEAAPARRSRAEIVQMQKKLAREWISRLFESYLEAVDRGDEESFWESAAKQIRKTRGLEEEDIEKIVIGVRKIVEDSARGKDASTKKADAKDVKNTGKDIETLKRSMREKAEILSQKREAIKKMHDQVQRLGIKKDYKKEREDALRVFEQDYKRAYKDLMDARAEKKDGREKRILSACEEMDEVTQKSAEKEGAGQIVDKATSWFKGMGGRLKRAATITFVAVGLVVTLSSTIGKEKSAEMVDAFVNGSNTVAVEHVTHDTPEKKNIENESSEQLKHTDFANDSLKRELPAVDIGDLVGNADREAQPDEMRQAVEDQKEHLARVTVEKNDTLWDIIESQLEDDDRFEKLSEKQKIIAIDALKDKFAQMNSDQLAERGFTHGNIDQIYPGEHIDLADVLGNPDVVAQAITIAKQQ